MRDIRGSPGKALRSPEGPWTTVYGHYSTPSCVSFMSLLSDKNAKVFCPVTLKVRVNFNVTLFSYTRAFGDGPRNFEPWSSDEDDTRAGTPSPNYHTNGRTFSS
ncbi:hypothetical protein TNCV_5045941 [Trichonephila clavipes]|uniref:Uncharacterized protein n=1 Tax=Trichonephila clavipes TaxID=2585209 RepID=A0A8X7BL46_TRICX|nr:hypothetical protein TNCV_5045941 [Trichonephila clavipes]